MGASLQKKVVLVVYRDDTSGPTRGAKAIEGFDKNISIAYLFIGKRKINFNTLKLILFSKEKILIGFGLLPDLLISLFGIRNSRVSYIRGDIRKNYKVDFGIYGGLVTRLHLMVINSFEAVFFLTNANRNEYSSKLNTKLYVVPNTVDLSNITLSNEIASRNELSVVVVGGLNARKRPLEALRIINRLNKNLKKSVKIKFFGDGPMRNKISKFAELNGIDYQIFGLLPDPYSHIRKKDILLHCSNSEGASRSVLEALGLGIKVLSAHWPGVEEIICDGDNAHIFSTLDEAVEILFSIHKNTSTLRPRLLQRNNRDMVYKILFETLKTIKK